MKFFKDSKRAVFAYEDDGSQDSAIPADLTPITKAEADALRFPAPSDEQLAAAFRAERDAKMAAFQWRIDRFTSEVRLGLKPTDDIAVLDVYMQKLRDITQQATFPASVTWPDIPA